MTLTRRRDIDMTAGPLLSKMLVFIFPLMISNLLQAFYNAADMIIVGFSSEPDALGAIGTTASFTSLILNLLVGISVGANVVVARHIGAKEEEKASRAVHTATVVGLAVGIVGAVIGYIITPTVMRMIGNEGKLLELSVRYARVYFMALPFHALSNFSISIHRAKGDTRTPLIVLSCTGLLNVALNLFFVLVCGMSVEGVAIATGIAAAASTVALYANLARDKGPCHFSLRLLRLDVAEVKPILRIGIPAGVQSGLFSISNMIIQSSVLQINNAVTPSGAAYAPVVKANAAVANIGTFAFTAMNAASLATVSFTSQNLGAKNYTRVKRVAALSYALLIAISASISLILILCYKPLYAIYDVRDLTDALSQITWEAAKVRMWWIWPFFFTSAFMDCGSSILRGLGKSILATVSCLIGTCALRIVWIYTVFRAVFTLDMIYISYPISWVLTGVTLLGFALWLFSRFPKEPAVSE